MFYNEFIELDPPIGTKVRFRDTEWVFIGYGISLSKSTTIQLTRGDSGGGYPITNYIDEYEDREIEIIGIPTYKTPPKYKVGDMVYRKQHKCIILEDRDDDYDKYFVYNTVLKCSDYYKEQDLFSKPQDQNEVEKLEVKGDGQE